MHMLLNTSKCEVWNCQNHIQKTWNILLQGIWRLIFWILAFLNLEQKAAGLFLPESLSPQSDYTTYQEAILCIISRLRHRSLRTVNEILVTSNINVKQSSQDLIRTHYLNFIWNLTPAPYCIFWFVSKCNVHAKRAKSRCLLNSSLLEMALPHLVSNAA